MVDRHSHARAVRHDVTGRNRRHRRRQHLRLRDSRVFRSWPLRLAADDAVAPRLRITRQHSSGRLIVSRRRRLVRRQLRPRRLRARNARASSISSRIVHHACHSNHNRRVRLQHARAMFERITAFALARRFLRISVQQRRGTPIGTLPSTRMRRFRKAARSPGTLMAFALAFSYVIGWAPAASDYSRYLPADASRRLDLALGVPRRFHSQHDSRSDGRLDRHRASQLI